MKLSDTPLRVVANPFAAPLDSKGRACALTETDPTYPSAARYIGARTVSSAVKRLGNLFGDKTKVSVVYDLRPVSIVDTSFHRTKLATGEAFAEDGAQEKLLAAAHARLAETPLEKGAVLTAWRAQGLAIIADAIDPPAAPTKEESKEGSPDAAPPAPSEARAAETKDATTVPAPAGEGAVS